MRSAMPVDWAATATWACEGAGCGETGRQEFVYRRAGGRRLGFFWASVTAQQKAAMGGSAGDGRVPAACLWRAAVGATGKGRGSSLGSRAAWRGSVPCRLKRRAGRGQWARGAAWSVDAACRGRCSMQQRARMRPGGLRRAVTVDSRALGGSVESSRRAWVWVMRRLRARTRTRGGGRGGGRQTGRAEAESTHHPLRRYRRRLFLILPGPIWGMRLRHCYCWWPTVGVEGTGSAGPGAATRVRAAEWVQ